MKLLLNTAINTVSKYVLAALPFISTLVLVCVFQVEPIYVGVFNLVFLLIPLIKNPESFSYEKLKPELKTSFLIASVVFLSMTFPPFANDLSLTLRESLTLWDKLAFFITFVSTSVWSNFILNK